MKSAEARLHAMGMFHTTASRNKAFTSGSWGCGSRGSQKKMRKSISPSAIIAPICWSPPSGPLWSLDISIASSCSSSLPVVPVAYTSSWVKRFLLNLAYSSKSCFLLSCAMRATFFRLKLNELQAM